MHSCPELKGCIAPVGLISSCPMLKLATVMVSILHKPRPSGPSSFELCTIEGLEGQSICLIVCSMCVTVYVEELP